MRSIKMPNKSVKFCNICCEDKFWELISARILLKNKSILSLNPSENRIGGFLSIVERIWDLPAAAELDWFGLSSF